MLGVIVGIAMILFGAASMDSMDITIPVIMLVIGMVVSGGSWELFVKDVWVD